MILLLRAKPGGNEVPVTIADYAYFEMLDRYTLIYGVYNAILLPTTYTAQLSCFHQVAKHLIVEGRFVIEAETPDLTGFVNNCRVQVLEVDEGHVELRVTRHRPSEQLIIGQTIWLTNEGVRLRPSLVRYASPSELDLMAADAGLRLETRFGGWNHEPFTDRSGLHVSVYVKPR